MKPREGNRKETYSAKGGQAKWKCSFAILLADVSETKAQPFQPCKYMSAISQYSTVCMRCGANVGVFHIID